MRCIRITGRRGCGKTRVARARYQQLASEGVHVVLDDKPFLLTNFPERRLSAAAVLITVHDSDGDLIETTTQ